MLLISSAALISVRYGTGAYDGGYHLVASFDRSSQGSTTSPTSRSAASTWHGCRAIRLRADGRADVTLT